MKLDAFPFSISNAVHSVATDFSSKEVHPKFVSFDPNSQQIMPAYLTFVRHGQTFNNVAGVVQGRTGGELTAKGKDMASCLGRLLAEEDETFTRIFSSDLHRCVQTTAQILDQLKTKLPEALYTSQLRERDYGDWELQKADIQPILDKISEMKLESYEHHKIDVPNGETYEETKERGAKFFQEILKIVDQVDENQTENILAVSHGVFIICFIEMLMESKDFILKNFNEDQLKFMKAENTCRTRFEISKPEAEFNGKRVITFTHFFDTEHYKYLSEV